MARFYSKEKVITRNHLKHLYLLCGVSSAVMAGVSGLLYWEYQQFHEHISTMLHVRSVYRKQLACVKKYAQKVKPQEPTLQGMQEQGFVLVNRDPEYLQQHFKDFVQAQKVLKPGQSLSDVYDHAEFYFIAQEYERKQHRLKHRLQHNKSVKKLAKSVQHVPQGLPLLWPIDLSLFWISSLFGPRKKPNGRPGFHHGIDLAASKGTPVKAAYAGTVLQAQYVPGYGNTIIVVHNKTYRTRYAHLDKILVKKGQSVKAGHVIGTVGATGYVRMNGTDPSHLHFEVHKHGKHVNPIHYLFH